MKLIYNTDLQVITDGVLVGYNINIRKDIRIESDSYVLLETESLLIDFGLILAIMQIKMIDYNDFRKYIIINLLPNWNDFNELKKGQLKAFYIVPNDYVWDNSESTIYKSLVDNATNCREKRIDEGRSYVSLFYKNDIQKSMDFFIDTELLMNQYIKGKIPALQAFINNENIAGFDYRTNGFNTKSYYDVEIKDQLNYLLFR